MSQLESSLREHERNRERDHHSAESDFALCRLLSARFEPAILYFPPALVFDEYHYIIFGSRKQLTDAKAAETA